MQAKLICWYLIIFTQCYSYCQFVIMENESDKLIRHARVSYYFNVIIYLKLLFILF